MAIPKQWECSQACSTTLWEALAATKKNKGQGGKIGPPFLFDPSALNLIFKESREFHEQHLK